MMTIQLNSISISVQNKLSLKEFLVQQKSTSIYFAVALNRQFIPKIKYAETILSEGDTVEIILPMQGG